MFNLSKIKPIWILRFACFCQIAGLGFLTTYEAVHMRQNGLSNGTVGNLLTLQFGLIIIMGPIWGRLADLTLRYKEIVILGMVGLIGSIWIFSYAHDFKSFLIYSCLRGALFPAVNGIMPALAIHNIGKKGQGKGFGGYRAFGSIGFMTATFFLPLFFHEIPAIARAASCFLPFAIYALITLKNPQVQLGARKRFNLKSIPVPLYYYFIAYFLISMTEPAVHAFFGAYGNSLGASDQLIGQIASINGLLALFALPIVGRWIDIKGPRFIILLGMLSQCLRMFTTAQITDPHYLWIPQLFHFLGWAGIEIGTIIYVSSLMDEKDKATGLSIAVSVKVLGMMAGASLMGHLTEAHSYPYMYNVVGTIAFVGTVLFFFQKTAGSSANSGLPSTAG